MKIKLLKVISKPENAKIFLVGQTKWKTFAHKIFASGQWISHSNPGLLIRRQKNSQWNITKIF